MAAIRLHVGRVRSGRIVGAVAGAAMAMMGAPELEAETARPHLVAANVKIRQDRAPAVFSPDSEWLVFRSDLQHDGGEEVVPHAAADGGVGSQPG